MLTSSMEAVEVSFSGRAVDQGTEEGANPHGAVVQGHTSGGADMSVPRCVNTFMCRYGWSGLLCGGVVTHWSQST